MAEVTKLIRTAPERVFEVLSDGWLYTGWVVGASHVRAVEPSWPAPGARIHHAVGAWPLMLARRDQGRGVRTVETPGAAGPRAAARRGPGGASLEPHPSGTLIRMSETPVSGPGKWLHNPAADALLRARNAESLGRLAALTERPGGPR